MMSNGFWDSSALVTLCVRQPASSDFRKLWRQSSRVAAWSGSPVEIRSALARLHRSGELTVAGLRTAVSRLEAMRRQWREIVASDQLHALAEELPDRYGVRALDAFQLAAALIWCQAKPKGRLFVCDDVRLSAAASQAGFLVQPD